MITCVLDVVRPRLGRVPDWSHPLPSERAAYKWVHAVMARKYPIPRYLQSTAADLYGPVGPTSERRLSGAIRGRPFLVFTPGAAVYYFCPASRADWASLLHNHPEFFTRLGVVP